MKHSIKISVSQREWIHSTHLSTRWHLLRCASRIIIIKSLNSRVKEIAHLPQITRLLLTNCKCIHKQYINWFDLPTKRLIPWSMHRHEVKAPTMTYIRNKVAEKCFEPEGTSLYLRFTHKPVLISFDEYESVECVHAKDVQRERRKSEFGASSHKNQQQSKPNDG